MILLLILGLLLITVIVFLWSCCVVAGECSKLEEEYEDI